MSITNQINYPRLRHEVGPPSGTVVDQISNYVDSWKYGLCTYNHWLPCAWTSTSSTYQVPRWFNGDILLHDSVDNVETLLYT